jgi:hypothetical protein
MKSIARALVIATLATAATGAMAADTPYPSSAQDQVPLSQEFPNIVTYKQEHRDSISQQQPMTYPAQALQEYPLSGEFPNLQSYQDIHKNDPVAQSNTPDYPYSVDPERSMAEEGLVPGIAGVPPYDNRNTQTAVGATR